jgi:hypothetical protein
VIRLGAEDRARRTKVGMTAPGSQTDHRLAVGKNSVGDSRTAHPPPFLVSHAMQVLDASVCDFAGLRCRSSARTLRRPSRRHEVTGRAQRASTPRWLLGVFTLSRAVHQRHARARPNAKSVPKCVYSGRGAAWLACLLWEQEVGGSNPPAPTFFTLSSHVARIIVTVRGGWLQRTNGSPQLARMAN